MRGMLTCPVCEGRGTNVKTYHYREYPGGIGDVGDRTKNAVVFPPGGGELIPRTVTETCHRCGGRGEVVGERKEG